MSKIKIEEIRKAAKEHGWEVVSKEYSNLQTEMEFKCNEGHKIIAPYKKIRDSWVCPVCKYNYFKKRVNTELVPKKKETYRVLGIDQATHTSGFSIFDNGKLIRSGIYIAEDESDEIERDKEIANWLINMIDIWEPDIIGFEDIQLQQFNNSIVGITTYKVLAHLQGILFFVCNTYGIDYKVCPPATWRSHCQVKGRTKVDKKRSMQLLVKQWYDITITDDEADAIGIGKYVADTTFKKPQYKISNWEE